ncbi:PWWP domain-containing protein 2A [Saguinus oedipus]|uniref:PWWP domain-containing protein 2A n=1 Tax=Saguinus oedipus TaxID=9490 RepID=A0ABQ9W6G7_SAGOE|nr:PWWP domain-containing protein 2A [Saguinus oedipus]
MARAGRKCPGNQAALPPPPLQPELEEGEARKKMAAVAAEAAATAASPGEGGAGEAEPEMEPIPGSEAGTDPLPVTATEASSAPQADEPPLPPPPPPPGELARSPEAAGPELEAEEKLSVRGGPELPPPSAPPQEQPPAPEEREEPQLPHPAAPALVPPAGGDSTVSQLIPGSEVRVTLDHIIEDALVVSFRLGEKLFSGVLMDLSKRYRVRPRHAAGASPERPPFPEPSLPRCPGPRRLHRPLVLRGAWNALRVGQARGAGVSPDGLAGLTPHAR